MLRPPDPRVDAVSVTLSGLNIGEGISYDEIESEHGIDPRQEEGRSICYRARERLRRDRGIVIRAVRGLGFKRLSDSSVVNSDFRRKRMIGQIKRENQELRSVDYNALPEKYKPTFVGRLAINSMMNAKTLVPPARMAAQNPSSPGKQMLEGLKKLFPDKGKKKKT